MRTHDLPERARPNAGTSLDAVLPMLFSVALMTVTPASLAQGTGDETPFDEAEIFLELNDTDGDLGIHASIDGDAWKKLEIADPNGRKMLLIRASGNLQQQGLTQLFFESAEPRFDELAPDEFFSRFPEGKYEIEGMLLDEQELESTAELTHVMPTPAGHLMFNGLAAAENCDADLLPTVSPPVVVTWTVSPLSHPTIGVSPQVPVNIVKQQLVVERMETEMDPLLILSIDLPPGSNSFVIPEDFTSLYLGEPFKFEILLREESGNQTATETCFKLP